MQRISSLSWFSVKFLFQDKIRLLFLIAINVIALCLVFMGLSFIENVQFNLQSYTQDHFAPYWILPKGQGTFLQTTGDHVAQPRLEMNELTKLLNEAGIDSVDLYHLAIGNVRHSNSNEREKLILIGKSPLNSTKRLNQIPSEITLSNSFAQFINITVGDEIMINENTFTFTNTIPEQVGAFPQGYLPYHGNESIFGESTPHFATISGSTSTIEALTESLPISMQIVPAEYVADAMYAKYLALEMILLLGLIILMSSATVFISLSFYLISQIFRFTEIIEYLFKSGQTITDIIYMFAFQITIFYFVISIISHLLNLLVIKYLFSVVYANVTYPVNPLVIATFVFLVIAWLSLLQPVFFLKNMKEKAHL